MTDKKISRTDKLQRWSKLVAEQKRSGVSVSAFCRDHGVHRDTFKYWDNKIELSSIKQPSIKRLKPSSAVSRFVALTKNVSTTIDAKTPQIHLPNGVTIELNAKLGSCATDAFLKALCGIESHRDCGGRSLKKEAQSAKS